MIDIISYCRGKECMGFFSGLLMVGAAGLVLKGISESRKEREEEERRRNTPCKFSNQLTKEDFEEIVNHAIKGVKRKKIEIAITGPVIKGEVVSQSGLSTWKFSIDFNDYGKISGKYWIKTENSDSTIPKHIAEEIKTEIEKII